jgi:hypothetical protein
MEPNRFRAILYSNPLNADADSFYHYYLELLYPQVETEIFAYGKPYTQLNLHEKQGVTAYHSSNMV